MPLNFIDPAMTSGLLKTSNNLSELTATIETVYTNTGIDHTVPVGVIFPWCSDNAVAPVGWLFCNGQAVSRSAYSALFAVIGILYGEGNTTTTFNLPDLRGRVMAGIDTTTDSAGRIDSAIDTGDAYTVGATGGADAVTLSRLRTNAAAGTTNYLTTGTDFNVVQPTLLIQYIIRTDVANVGAP
jgi:hypothetical protein